MSDLDLTEFLDRAEAAHAFIRDTWGFASELPQPVRQHFNYDVPAMLGAIRHLQAAYDGMEEQGSALTREVDLKTRDIEALKAELAEARGRAEEADDRAADEEAVAAQRLDEILRLRARMAELESHPVSGTPHYIPPREGLPAEAILGWTAVADPPAEAGIAAEDNLPGLTAAERDDFMGGAA